VDGTSTLLPTSDRGKDSGAVAEGLAGWEDTVGAGPLGVADATGPAPADGAGSAGFEQEAVPPQRNSIVVIAIPRRQPTDDGTQERSDDPWDDVREPIMHAP
jgi:hypothetical protein